MQLMFCGKDIERIGDRATNIAETVYYMIKGSELTDQRPTGDPTSFPSALRRKRKNGGGRDGSRHLDRVDYTPALQPRG
jgi:hypothetical protein